MNNQSEHQAVIDQLLTQVAQLHLELAQLRIAVVKGARNESPEPATDYIESNGVRIPIPDNISSEALETLKNLDIR